ncbi:MAG: DNA primase DnaG [Haloferacaceae archaeon]
MDDTAKYLIHASLVADGVVERSDVVGAVFGQTEGLLGDELDLRDLQQSSKVGRIDVEVTSENGRSTGEITIATSLDKVETAILAASLETITRVGPCRSSVEVTDIEDVREAKRREVVERAKELLRASFDDTVMSSAEILEEVRESVRVEDITDYDGLPAGPRVADSDAIIVVEGRADVLTLLRYGIKNAVAVEGTDVPEAVAELTQDRTVTAFFDGDRGGELILRELAQVGDVDYVTFAPDGRSVEDLSRSEVLTALREKVPYESLPETGDVRSAVVTAAEDAANPPTASRGAEASATPAPADGETEASEVGDGGAVVTTRESGAEGPTESADAAVEAEAGSATKSPSEASAETEPVAEEDAETGPTTLREHVADVEGTGVARSLDSDFATLAEVPAEEAFESLRDAETVPYAVVLDGELTQRVLDVAAQRGVQHVVARDTGEFVKQPVDVRVRTADQLVG